MTKQEVKVEKSKTEKGWKFNVTVNEKGSSTRHQVTMSKDFYTSLDTKTKPEEIIKKSFNFLLEREPKEMILSKFDVTVISRYFPEFENQIKERL